MAAARAVTGEIGVSIFFVISGFLITTLLLQERGRTGGVDLRAFYGRRFRRIFPAYYVYLIIITVFSVVAGVEFAWRDLVAAALYLSDYDGQQFIWLAHTWSLAVETQFYLIWPLIFVFAGVRWARTVAIVCIVLDPVVRVASYVLVPSQRDLIGVTLHTRIDMLMFGCATALIVEKGLPPWLQTAVTRVRPALCLVILALCICSGALFRGAFQFSIGTTIEGAAIALMLLGVLEFPDNGIARILASNPATWLGRISYSVYLWQQPFFFPLGQPPFFARFPLDLICTLGAACLSYYFVERVFFRAKPVLLSAPALSENRT